MKNILLKFCLVFSFSFLNLFSYGIQIKLVIDKSNKISFYREDELLVDNGFYELVISKNEQVKFILQNKSSQTPALKFISLGTGANSLSISPSIFSTTNHIETDENQKLNYSNTSFSLDKPFEIILSTGATNTNNINFSISYKENVSAAANGNATTQVITQLSAASSDAKSKKFISGCAVTDAIALNSPGELTSKELLQLLSHYFPKASNDSGSMISAARSNNFLKSILSQTFADAKPEPDKKAVIESDKGAGLLSDFSSIGGLDVTNIADGFAKFLVKRTKEELSIAFFDKMKKDLESPQFKDLQSLFPKTYGLLLAIGTDIYSYQRYLQNLREAYKADMDNLVKNLPSIIDNHPAFFAKNKELSSSLKSSCYVANELENHSHPGDILANYPIKYLTDFETTTHYASGSVQTLQLINMSMRKALTGENIEGDYWVDISQVRKMVNDKKTFKIYLGLLMQEMINNYTDISYKDKVTLKSVLEDIANTYDATVDDYEQYKQYILQFAQKTDAMNKMIRSYKNKPVNDSAAFELYARYFTASVDMIEYATKASELPYIKNTSIGNLHDTLQPYFEITYKAVDLSVDINRKNYSSAINNVVSIYDLVKTRKEIVLLEGKIDKNLNKFKFRKKNRINNRHKKKLKKIKEKASQTDGEKNEIVELDKSIAAFAELDSNFINRKINKKNLDTLKETLGKLAHYGAFFSTVAQAKNSDEVENAIETFALPTGSYRIKKESIFNVSLNAYCGFFSGHESIKPFQLKNQHFWNSYGMTAPIGIEASLGGRRKNASYSLFVSLIDLGAVTAFRFENDTTKTLAKIELRDIVAPGIYFSYGFPKKPISFNIGYQMTPLLSKVETDKNIYQPNYSRISIGLCVDIPVFNLFTKTRE